MTAVASPEMHGAVGDGVTDDTDALTEAVSAAGATGCVELAPGKTYGTTGITLGNYTKIRGYGATLRLLSGAGPVVTAPAQGSLQTGQFSELDGVLVDGVSKAPGTVGIKVNAHSAFITRNVRVIRCETGFDMRGMQFASFYSPKAYDCVVGFYLESLLARGGGSSNSFYDLQAIGNAVGVIVNKTAGWPQHSIMLRNPSLLANTVCGLAAFGTDNLIVDGCAPEANADGAATLVYNGRTIKRASYYLSGASLTHRNGYIAEAAADPVFLLENGSALALSDTAGYGNTAGRLVSADASSVVTLGGDHAAMGTVEGCTISPVSIRSYTVAVLTSPNVAETSAILNSVERPQLATPADTVGAADHGLADDPVFGQSTSVTFPTAPTGRIRWALTNAGTTGAVAFLVKSDVDADFLFGHSREVGNKYLTLRAVVWTRVVWMSTGLALGPQAFLLKPKDAAGATLQLCKLHHLSGTDGPELRRQISALFSGTYNPNT